MWSSCRCDRCKPTISTAALARLDTQMPWLVDAPGHFYLRLRLKLVPEILIVNFMVELHLWAFYHCAQQTSAAVGRRLFQICITPFHILAEQLRRPLGRPEILDRSVDVIRKIPLSLAQIFQVGGVAFDASLEDAEHH